MIVWQLNGTKWFHLLKFVSSWYRSVVWLYVLIIRQSWIQTNYRTATIRNNTETLNGFTFGLSLKASPLTTSLPFLILNYMELLIKRLDLQRGNAVMYLFISCAWNINTSHRVRRGIIYASESCLWLELGEPQQTAFLFNF